MDNRLSKSKVLIYGGMLALVMSSAYADSACHAEVASIQAELDAPAAWVSPNELKQAKIMTNVLSEDCAGGSSLDSVIALADNIRTVLGMGGRL
jgi:hypothetical protein